MSLYTFIHNLLNVLVQIANKMGFKKKRIFLGVKDSERVSLTTLAPSLSRLSRYMAALTSHSPTGLHGLLQR
jgi:hypothetical protein